jgi:RNA polymerase sigma factor (sigma-70 family)
MGKIENSELFLSVIESNKGIIYKIANAYCKNTEDKKDLVQEIILRLWQAFEQYNDQYKYSTWIYRIALNTAISNYRKEKVREKHLYPAISETFFDFKAISYREEEEEYACKLLHQFIQELKELDKALMLLYLEGKSYHEIAEIIGISESNVGTKIGRIKVALKNKFSSINN